MNVLRRLIPERLRALDLYLQENHPRLWATRIHYHLWFLLLVNLLVFALGVSLSVTDRHFPEPEMLWGYMILPAVVYFAFWTYRVVLFTVERRFGRMFGYAEVGEFLVHFISIALIFSIPYTLSLTVAFRAAHLTSDEDLVREVNTLNEQAHWFYGHTQYYDTVDRKPQYGNTGWEVDVDVAELYHHAQLLANGRPDRGHGTHQYFRNLEEFTQRDQEEEGSVEREKNLHDYYSEILRSYNHLMDQEGGNDPAAARLLLPEIDSIERHFPLLYTNFGAFTPYAFDDELAFASDSVLEVRYLEAYRANTPPLPRAIDEAQLIALKYHAFVRILPAEQVIAEFRAQEPSTAGLSGARDPIRLIAEAKVLGYWFARWEFLAFAVVMISFGLALLISIFKNIYWQPFLITLVVAALLPIVILLFALITEHTVFHARDENIMLWCYYLIMLFVLAMLFRVPSLTAYRTRSAVMAILANVALPAFWVFTLFMLQEQFDVFGIDALDQALQYAHGTDHDRLWLLRNEKRDLFERCMTIALWGGLAFYLFALHPFMRHVYTRLMALPERK